MRVLKCEWSLFICDPQACPAPLDGSTSTFETIALALAFEKPNFIKILGKSFFTAAGLGYFFFVIFVK